MNATTAVAKMKFKFEKFRLNGIYRLNLVFQRLFQRSVSQHSFTAIDRPVHQHFCSLFLNLNVMMMMMMLMMMMMMMMMMMINKFLERQIQKLYGFTLIAKAI